MTSYELLGYAVLKRAIFDLYQGYRELGNLLGENMFNIEQWQKTNLSKQSVTMKRLYPHPIYKFRKTDSDSYVVHSYKNEQDIGWIFADALFFIYSDECKYFTIWQPEYIITKVKKMHKKYKGKSMPFSITIEEINPSPSPAHTERERQLRTLYSSRKHHSKKYYT